MPGTGLKSWNIPIEPFEELGTWFPSLQEAMSMRTSQPSLILLGLTFAEIFVHPPWTPLAEKNFPSSLWPQFWTSRSSKHHPHPPIWSLLLLKPIHDRIQTMLFSLENHQRNPCFHFSFPVKTVFLALLTSSSSHAVSWTLHCKRSVILLLSVTPEWSSEPLPMSSISNYVLSKWNNFCLLNLFISLLKLKHLKERQHLNGFFCFCC